MMCLRLGFLRVAAWGPYTHVYLARTALNATSDVVLGAVLPDASKVPPASPELHTFGFAARLYPAQPDLARGWACHP